MAFCVHKLLRESVAKTCVRSMINETDKGDLCMSDILKNYTIAVDMYIINKVKKYYKRLLVFILF